MPLNPVYGVDMDENQQPRPMQAFIEAWTEAMRRKEFYAALEQGIAAYLFFRAKGHTNYTNGALALAAKAIDAGLTEMYPAKEERACSFCGRSGDDVRLGAGPKALICSECVEQFHEIFSDPSQR
jgi:hypothetical protein